MPLRAPFEAVLMLMLIACVCSNDKARTSTPLWKSLLSHHRKWGGYYIHDQTRFMCKLFVHYVQLDDQGTASVTFTSERFHIEMTGFSDDDEVVVFREVHTWNKSGHFDGHTNIAFQGSFASDYAYYKFVANVSSQESQNYGSIYLIPQGDNRIQKSDEPKNKSMSLALAITIPLFLGVVILILAAFLIIWAVRKGYLRHVPWAYKAFRNPKTPKPDLEMESGTSEPQTQTETGARAVEAIDSQAVHM